MNSHGSYNCKLYYYIETYAHGSQCHGFPMFMGLNYDALVQVCSSAHYDGGTYVIMLLQGIIHCKNTLYTYDSAGCIVAGMCICIDTVHVRTFSC